MITVRRVFKQLLSWDFMPGFCAEYRVATPPVKPGDYPMQFSVFEKRVQDFATLICSDPIREVKPLPARLDAAAFPVSKLRVLVVHGESTQYPLEVYITERAGQVVGKIVNPVTRYEDKDWWMLCPTNLYRGMLLELLNQCEG